MKNCARRTFSTHRMLAWLTLLLVWISSAGAMSVAAATLLGNTESDAMTSSSRPSQQPSVLRCEVDGSPDVQACDASTLIVRCGLIDAGVEDRCFPSS
jgi:hypothetical protein